MSDEVSLLGPTHSALRIVTCGHLLGAFPLFQHPWVKVELVEYRYTNGARYSDFVHTRTDKHYRTSEVYHPVPAGHLNRGSELYGYLNDKKRHKEVLSIPGNEQIGQRTVVRTNSAHTIDSPILLLRHSRSWTRQRASRASILHKYRIEWPLTSRADGLVDGVEVTYSGDFARTRTFRSAASKRPRSSSRASLPARNRLQKPKPVQKAQTRPRYVSPSAPANPSYFDNGARDSMRAILQPEARPSNRLRRREPVVKGRADQDRRRTVTSQPIPLPGAASAAWLAEHDPVDPASELIDVVQSALRDYGDGGGDPTRFADPRPAPRPPARVPEIGLGPRSDRHRLSGVASAQQAPLAYIPHVSQVPAQDRSSSLYRSDNSSYGYRRPEESVTRTGQSAVPQYGTHSSTGRQYTWRDV